MCKAMEEMKNEAEAKKEAMNIKKVMEKLQYSIEQAMELLDVPVSDYDKYRKLVTE